MSVAEILVSGCVLVVMLALALIAAAFRELAQRDRAAREFHDATDWEVR